MIHGEDLIVATNVRGTMQAVAASKTCTVNIQQNSIGACSPEDGRTRQKIPTDYGWSISVGCLMANNRSARDFLAAILNGYTMSVQFTMVGYKVRGDAIVEDWKATGTKGSLATFDLTFAGSGPLVPVGNWLYHNYVLYIDGTVTNNVMSAGGTLTEDGVFKSSTI